MSALLKRSYPVVLTLLFQTLPLLAEQWNHYVPFSGTEKMAETKRRVYFNSAGSLFAYDKEDDETIRFSSLTDLNDIGVTGVFAPFSSNMVTVSYENGNIDLISDRGYIINLPDIKDANVRERHITDIAFSDDGKEMLVGTGFGIVRFNLVKNEVVESGIFNHEVSTVAYVKGIPFMIMDNRLYSLKAGSRMGNLNNWTDHEYANFNEIHGYADLLYCTGPTGTYILSFPDGNISRRKVAASQALSITTGNAATPVWILFEDRAVGFDSDGTITETVPVANGDEAVTSMTFTEGLRKAWIGSSDGIACADFNSSTPVFLTESFKPSELSVKQINFLRREKSGNLYMGNRGNSNVLQQLTRDHKGYQSVMDKDGSFRDLTPKRLSHYWSNYPNTKGEIFDVTFIREDENNEKVYFTGNITEGFYALDNATGKELAHINSSNSLIRDNYGDRAMDIVFDPYNSMWVLTEATENNPKLLRMNRGNDEIVTTEWEAIEESRKFTPGRDAMMEISSDGRLIFCLGAFEILVHDTRNTESTVDDETLIATNFIMADGSGKVDPGRFTFIVEDDETHELWIGSTDGVFIASDPLNIVNGVMELARPKVARNDGSGLADYLLSTQTVFGIAIDPIGQKWIGTRDSGVFLVSCDGESILKNYKSDNSSLPTNAVYSVECDQNGTVYFGTGYGLFELKGETTAGNVDYNDVKIYPNPVRPDYFGEITIEGLMDGSQVKIVDSSGSLVAELQSEGGRVKWSGRNGSRRMPSGVYHVLASSVDNSGKPVGKIVIIR